MRHAPMRFYFGPPNPAVPDAHAIHIERFGNDDVIDAGRGEPTALRQVVYAAVAAGFFIDGAGDFQRSRQTRARIDQRFDRDDGCRESALHVTRTSTVHFAVSNDRGKRIDGPSGTRLHHIDMAVEVHAGPARSTFAARDDIDARMALTVAGRAGGMHILDGETTRAQTPADKFGAGPEGFTGRVDSGKTNQGLRH